MHRSTTAVTLASVLALAAIAAVGGRSPQASGAPRTLLAAVTPVTPSPTPTAPRLPTAPPRLPTATPALTATVPATTPTPLATRTPRPLTTPLPTPTLSPGLLHPGFGAVPWANGEYSVWTLSGRYVHGTAWQLLTRSGHQWIDFSATRETAYGQASTFTSRLAFDVNTYLLRRYDGVEDAPASALRATLFGPALNYTSYKAWGQARCVVSRATVPPTTAAFGLLPDLLRATPLRGKQSGAYPLFDPYGRSLVTTGRYTTLHHDVLSTILGRVNTLRVEFHEGSQPTLDVWYATTPAHTVVKWGMPGIFGATLTHYEAQSTRTALPIPPVTLKLPARDAACF